MVGVGPLVERIRITHPWNLLGLGEPKIYRPKEVVPI